MKKINLFIVLTILINISIYSQSTVDTLTNEKVITLSKIGLQPSVIINKIQSSYTFFDVRTDALIDLSKNGVHSDVINEMILTNNKHLAEINSEKDLMKVPEDMHKSGIYYYNQENTESPLTYLYSVKVNYTESSGGYGAWGGSSTTANLNGLESKLKIGKSTPVFYFYFENKGNYSDWFDATSPNEFELAKLKVKNGKRFVKVGGSSSGAFSSSASSGIPEEFKVPFESEQIKEGIFKVTFSKPLVEGEYCFVFSSNTYKVFDFSVKVQ